MYDLNYFFLFAFTETAAFLGVDVESDATTGASLMC